MKLSKQELQLIIECLMDNCNGGHVSYPIFRRRVGDLMRKLENYHHEKYGKHYEYGEIIADEEKEELE
jgi:hypothetical protein